MVMDPETAVAPTAQAPPDRPTMNLEMWARQGIALLFGDHKLDQEEMRIVRALFEEIALRAQNGGIGAGGTPPADLVEQGGMPPDPMEMNGNVEDMGTVEGAELQEAY